MEQPLPAEVERLLQELRPEQPFNAARMKAARELGKLDASNLRIVNALIAAMESDSVPLVREAARESLQAPAHHEILKQHPDLMMRVPQVQVASRNLAASPSVYGRPRYQERAKHFSPVRIVLLVGLVALGVFAFYRPISRELRRRKTQAYGATLTHLCSIPVDGMARGDLPSVEGTPKLVVFENGPEILVAPSQWKLPKEWRADHAGEVDLVVCLDLRWREFQKCPYTSGHAIFRYRAFYRPSGKDLDKGM